MGILALAPFVLLALDPPAVIQSRCGDCHNAKNKASGFSVESPEAIVKGGSKFGKAIVGGHPEESMLLKLVKGEANPRMPIGGTALSAAEIKSIEEWIRALPPEGKPKQAAWRWPFEKPVAKEPPAVKNTAWTRNPIDRFILAKLEANNWIPAPEADRRTLIRRVTLDLIGLPPTPEETADFVATGDYEKLIDRLLADPRYGERWGRHWLDLARYGETSGLEGDGAIGNAWRYRDWVIDAFNKNLPYDRFALVQIGGGDEHSKTRNNYQPDAKNFIPTGFLRLAPWDRSNLVAREVRQNYLSEVTTATSSVFLGLTIGCARCHDHPYDPIKSKEYYGLFAFFNNIDGGPLDGNAAAPPPITRVAGPEQLEALAGVDKRLAELRARISETARGVTYDLAKDKDDAGPAKRGDYVWIDDRLPPGNEVVGAGPNVAWNFVGKPAPVFSGERSARLAAKGLQQLVFDKAVHGLRIGAGDKLFAHVFIDPKHPPKEIMLQWHTDGWKHRAFWGENLIPFGRDASTERRHLGKLPEAGKWIRLEVDAAQVGLTPGSVVTGWACTQIDGVGYWDRCGIVTQTPQDGGPFDSFAAWVRYEKSVNGAGLPKTLVPLLKLDPKTRTKAQTDQLLRHFLENAYSGTRDVFAPLNKELDNLTAEKKKLESTMPTTLVFKERPGAPREAYVLKRGEYDKKLEKIGRITPLESFRTVRLTLWDEIERRLISFREFRERYGSAPQAA